MRALAIFAALIFVANINFLDALDAHATRDLRPILKSAITEEVEAFEKFSKDALNLDKRLTTNVRICDSPKDAANLYLANHLVESIGRVRMAIFMAASGKLPNSPRESHARILWMAIDDARSAIDSRLVHLSELADKIGDSCKEKNVPMVVLFIVTFLEFQHESWLRSIGPRNYQDMV